MKDLKIEKIKIDEIKEYENNSKIHTSEQIQKIKYSISKFGYLQPILIDENNMILAGHGRYRALKELKYKEIPVIRHEHLTDTEKTAFSIADNSITMMTGFDEDLLKFQLNELEIDDFETDLLGLDELGIDFEIETQPLEGMHKFKNSEIDLNSFDEYMEVKIKFSYEEYDKLKYISQSYKNDLRKTILGLMEKLND